MDATDRRINRYLNRALELVARQAIEEEHHRIKMGLKMISDSGEVAVEDVLGLLDAKIKENHAQ